MVWSGPNHPPGSPREGGSGGPNIGGPIFGVNFFSGGGRARNPLGPTPGGGGGSDGTHPHTPPPGHETEKKISGPDVVAAEPEVMHVLPIRQGDGRRFNGL